MKNINLKPLVWQNDHPDFPPGHTVAIIVTTDNDPVLAYVAAGDENGWHASLYANAIFNARWDINSLWEIMGFLNRDEAIAACEMHYMANFGVEHK